MSASREPRLLTSYLRSERRRVGGLVAVLVVAMLLPVAGPVLIGRFVDAASHGQSTSVLVGIAALFLLVTLTADGLQLLVTWLSVRMAWRIGNRLRGDLACMHSVWNSPGTVSTVRAC